MAYATKATTKGGRNGRAILDNGGLVSELRGTNGGDVAAGSGADDDDVEGCIGHTRLPLAQNSGSAARATFQWFVEGASAAAVCRDR